VTLTLRFKGRRLWLVGFSPGLLFWGAIVLGPASIAYLDHWRWVPAALFAFVLLVSFHVVSFTLTDPPTFSYYIGPFRECRAALPSLELAAIVGDDDDDNDRKADDHIQVGPGTGIATFPCRKPEETIVWIKAGLTPIARVVSEGRDS
jgi:hypothetical protein